MASLLFKRDRTAVRRFSDARGSSSDEEMGASPQKLLFGSWHRQRGRAANYGGIEHFGLCREENHDRLGHTGGRLAPLAEENGGGQSVG
jgi:hypothetical protein